MSGFYCCAKSLVRVSQFSNTLLPFKPFLSQNKLSKLLKCFSPKDVSYLLQAFLSLKKRYGVETSFTIVKELTKIARLLPLEKDEMAEFFSSPHSCPYTLTKDRHGNHPALATSLSNFVKEVERRANSVGGVKWSGVEQQMLPNVADSAVSLLQGGHEERVQWSYAVLSGWGTPAQVLVGSLECSDKTGYLTITDSTATISLTPLLPMATQQSSTHTHPDLQNSVFHVGSMVLLSGLTVYVEKMASNSTSPPLIYICANLCTPVVSATTREDGDLIRKGRHLYFKVTNKNCVVVRQLNLMFTAQTKMAESFEMLKEIGADDKRDVHDKKSVEVALCFTEGAFKWYSFIINGGIYSIKSSKTLPSLKELSHTNLLQVTSDMLLEFIDHSLPQQVVYDTTDLIDRSPLSGCVTREGNREQPLEKSISAELFSLRGVVVSHEYRVHSSALLAPPTSAASISQQHCDTILALRVKSSTYPDTIMLYYGLKAGQPHPLGLLPGSEVTFHSLTCRTSKSGNLYCESTASSSITLHSVKTAPPDPGPPKLTSDLTPQLLSLPSSYLGDVMQSLLTGSLTARIICVQCRVTSVQWMSLQNRCLGCGCTIVDDVCMSACPQNRPTLKVEARLILDDGSGEGHLYANDDMVQEVMGVAYKEWEELKEIVIKIGHLTYTRNSGSLEQKGVPLKLLTVESRGKALICDLATRLSLHRPIKVYCRPFVSSAELQEGVLGQKQQVRRGFNTLSLPRLQLRAVAILELTCRASSNTGVCSSVTKHMLAKFKQLEITT